MRQIFSGAISFGLIHIPIKLYSGSTSTRIDLDFLHKKDKSPVGYSYICKKDDEKVKYDDIERGFKVSEGNYVVLTDEDFKNANVAKTNTIKVIHFVEGDEVDAKYFVKPFYLAPEENAEGVYALLKQSLKESRKVGICEYVMRGRERLGMLKTDGDAVILVQMRYQKELRDPKEIGLPTDVAIDKKQLDLSVKLINQLTSKFEPSKYKDDYIDELKELIDKKSKGIKPKPKGQAPKPTHTDELLEKLKLSLKETKSFASA